MSNEKNQPQHSTPQTELDDLQKQIESIKVQLGTAGAIYREAYTKYAELQATLNSLTLKYNTLKDNDWLPPWSPSPDTTANSRSSLNGSTFTDHYDIRNDPTRKFIPLNPQPGMYTYAPETMGNVDPIACRIADLQNKFFGQMEHMRHSFAIQLSLLQNELRMSRQGTFKPPYPTMGQWHPQHPSCPGPRYP